jgi:hypothetical protein
MFEDANSATGKYRTMLVAAVYALLVQCQSGLVHLVVKAVLIRVI